jgi:hypothetical protein
MTKPAPVAATTMGQARRVRQDRQTLTPKDAEIATTRENRCWSSLSPKPTPKTESSLA